MTTDDDECQQPQRDHDWADAKLREVRRLAVEQWMLELLVALALRG